MATPATLVLLRLDEPADEVLPSDAIGALADLNIDAGAALPPVASAFTGFGRSFSDGFGLTALDVVPGASLATRDASVQMLLFWDIAAQAAYGQPGTIIARGKGAAAAEYVSYSVELRVVNAALGIGELRFWWQTVAGVVKTQLGGHFLVPGTGYVMLTATRHWISTTEVELRYYTGGRLIGEFLSSDGDIGGGTTGTFCLGTRYDAGVAERFFHGVIDEVRVLNYELAPEEIEATWDRISRLQPRGYRAMRDLFQPGAPISDDPASRIQKLLRIPGHALGFAAAQAENFKRNQLPHRAYGPVLEEWEIGLGEAPRAGDALSQRRKRVVSHLRQSEGVSIPGVNATVADLLQLATSQVQVLAFDQTVREDFSLGLLTERWFVEPAADWTIAAAALRVQNAAAIPFDGSSRSWRIALQSMGCDGRAAQLLSKITPTTLAAGAEVGIVFYDWANGHAILLGLRNTAGVYQVITERFVDWASQGVTVREALGGLPAALWLHLRQQDPGGGGGGFQTAAISADYDVAWSITSGIAGFTTVEDIAHGSRHQWAGLYARTIGGAANIDASFDDVLLRVPFGSRSLRWYAFRDPALPGTPDLVGAHGAIQRLKHANTEATVITTKSLLCDSSNSGCDRGPLGAI